MRVAVTSNGYDLEASASPIFGRCPVYLIVDTKSMEFEALENPAAGASGGAGVQAAQFIANQRVAAVISGNVGPNAFQVLDSAGIPVYLFDEGKVREAVKAYKEGALSRAGSATAPEHAGMGRGRGRRGGSPPAPPGPYVTEEEEVRMLKEKVASLRSELAEVMERLEQLERGA
jgi:predicted Fe-Mo cluster-binding NifX family protein